MKFVLCKLANQLVLRLWCDWHVFSWCLLRSLYLGRMEQSLQPLRHATSIQVHWESEAPYSVHVLNSSGADCFLPVNTSINQTSQRKEFNIWIEPENFMHQLVCTNSPWNHWMRKIGLSASKQWLGNNWQQELDHLRHFLAPPVQRNST